MIKNYLEHRFEPKSDDNFRTESYDPYPDFSPLYELPAKLVVVQQTITIRLLVFNITKF